MDDRIGVIEIESLVEAFLTKTSRTDALVRCGFTMLCGITDLQGVMQLLRYVDEMASRLTSQTPQNVSCSRFHHCHIQTWEAGVPRSQSLPTPSGT